MLKEWGLKWSYSTAFYLGESTFSTLLSKRIEEGTGLQSGHGGKFQITSTDKGVGK
jgi:prolyl 4-hydroxylase